MPLTVYQYPNCSTCKKALAWLKANKVAFTSIDIVEDPPSKAQLEAAQKLAGVPVKKIMVQHRLESRYATATSRRSCRP